MTWAIGKARRAGFTLVELMLVLLVMGLGATAVALSLQPRQDSLPREAARFALAVRRASEEAMLSGNTLGLVIDAAGYEFVRHSAGTWRTVREPALQGRDWHPATYALLQDETGADQPPTASVPRIRFGPLGEATPFRLTLTRGSRQVGVTSDALAQAEIANDDR
ncbi:MAG: type II secretion system minor pseudopilin GspH [Rhodothalassiaceae bacterium]